MTTFQILTHLNIIQIYNNAQKLQRYFNAKSKKITLKEYLIVDDTNRVYIKVSKNGFDISSYQDDEKFINKFIEFMEDDFKCKHIAMHIDSGKYIKKLASSKLIDVSVL